MKERVFAIGSNGYYFIDGTRVDEDYWRKERMQEQLDRIEHKLDQLTANNGKEKE